MTVKTFIANPNGVSIEKDTIIYDVDCAGPLIRKACNDYAY